MLYLSIAIYLIFLSLRYDFSAKPSENIRILHRWLALTILVLLSGLRYRLAPDTVAYMAQFQNDVVPLGDLSLNYLSDARYQPLWVLLTAICKSFDSFILLQISVALIFNGSVFYFLRRVTKRFFTAILFFYFTCYFYFNMEIMREAMAVAMLLIAVVRYHDGRVLSFWFWLIISALFHKFALFIALAVPLILTTHISNTLKIVVPSIIVLILTNVVNPLEYIGNLGGFMNDLNLNFYEVDNKISTLGVVYHLLRIIPIVLLMLLYRNQPLPDLLLRKAVVFPLCWAYVFILIIRITSIPFMDRFANYFIFFVVACLVSSFTDLIEKARLKIFQIPIIASASLGALVFYVLPLLVSDPLMDDIPTYRRYYPYSSIIFQEIDADREQIILLEAKE